MNLQEKTMVADTIEQDVFINASVDVVWSLVSKCGFWVVEGLTFDHEAREGETVQITNPDYGTFPVRVERLDPPRYAAYRWAPGYPGTDLSDTNSTLVEFTMIEANGGVTVQFKESGFSNMTGTDEFREHNRGQNAGGWVAQLDSLRIAAEGKVQ